MPLDSLLFLPGRHAAPAPLAVAAKPELRSVAFISTMPPRQCGLATFTADLMAAVGGAAPELDLVAVVMSPKADQSLLSIPAGDRPSYAKAGRALARSGVDVISIQHEYGIFGGPDGEFLLDILDEANLPVVVTVHTALDQPSRNQRRVMDAIVRRAARVVVMTANSAAIMRAEHGVTQAKLRVIPHGIHLPPPGAREAGRAILAVGERPVLLTFGLLSPGKGIEHAIRALPAIKARCPDVLYVVVGVTHPNLLREEGERYRTSLQALADDLDVRDNVRFLDRFVALDDLLAMLAATDIYVTPYVNEAQSVSGTLAYSYGLGTPVVSTPYRHAAELLASGRGTLVPFADPGAIAKGVIDLLTDRARLDAIRVAARAAGRDMAWPRVGARYLEAFRDAAASQMARAPAEA